MTTVATDDLWEVIRKLDRDMRQAARLLGRREARYLVDWYYQLQEYRKAGDNQTRAAAEGAEPNRVLAWVAESMGRLEDNVRRALGEFAAGYRVGAWLQSITGIGPVISAGLLCHLDVSKAKTAGQFWRFAGLDADDEWLGALEARAAVGEIMGDDRTVTEAHVAACAARLRRHPEYVHRTAAFLTKKDDPKLTRELLVKVLSVRPWNAKLKVLLYKAEDCFVKFQNNKEDHYGRFFVERKAYEVRRSEAGELAQQAAAALEEKNYGKDTEARKWYEQGKLPPAHLNARAMRWTGKLFLSHLHEVMYRDYYGTAPPVPFSFDHCPGNHRHYVPPPVPFPGAFTGKGLRELSE